MAGGQEISNQTQIPNFGFLSRATAQAKADSFAKHQGVINGRELLGGRVPMAGKVIDIGTTTMYVDSCVELVGECKHQTVLYYSGTDYAVKFRSGFPALGFNSGSALRNLSIWAPNGGCIGLDESVSGTFAGFTVENVICWGGGSIPTIKLDTNALTPGHNNQFFGTFRDVWIPGYSLAGAIKCACRNMLLERVILSNNDASNAPCTAPVFDLSGSGQVRHCWMEPEVIFAAPNIKMSGYWRHFENDVETHVPLMITVDTNPSGLQVDDVITAAGGKTARVQCVTSTLIGYNFHDSAFAINDVITCAARGYTGTVTVASRYDSRVAWKFDAANVLTDVAPFPTPSTHFNFINSSKVRFLQEMTATENAPSGAPLAAAAWNTVYDIEAGSHVYGPNGQDLAEPSATGTLSGTPRYVPLYEYNTRTGFYEVKPTLT